MQSARPAPRLLAHRHGQADEIGRIGARKILQDILVALTIELGSRHPGWKWSCRAGLACQTTVSVKDVVQLPSRHDDQKRSISPVGAPQRNRSAARPDFNVLKDALEIRGREWIPVAPSGTKKGA